MLDVPDNGNLATVLNKRGVKKVDSYPAYLCTLESSFDALLRRQFVSKKRTELKKFSKRLRKLGDFEFVVLDNQCPPELLNDYLDTFFDLLKKRYSSKSEFNRHLFGQGQSFLREIVGTCLSKTLNFSIIKLDGIPISMATSYVYGNTLIYSIPVFDIAFQKYNLGHVHLMCLLQWAIENGFKKFDFSKGYDIYKSKWTNEQYNLSVYVLPIKGTFYEKILVNLFLSYFGIIAGMRKRGWNKRIKRVRYSLMSKLALQTKVEKEFNYQKFIMDGQEGSSGFSDGFEPFSYNKIHALPFNLKKDILEEVYQLYAKYTELFISKSKAGAVRILAGDKVIEWIKEEIHIPANKVLGDELQ